jgi:WhiB family redox-sensing transcriptional regulator
MAELRRLPGPAAEVWDWQWRALCRELDSAVFFALDRERGRQRARRERLAKAVCAQCPVIDDCRRHALRAREPFGVWGGMTEQERRIELGGRAVVA